MSVSTAVHTQGWRAARAGSILHQMTPGDSPTNSARIRMAETASGARGAAIHPALLRAAAQTPLTPDANFDAAALRAILQHEAAPPAATPLAAKLPAPTPGASP